MKKLKALKGALIGVFVVAVACCVFAACSSGDDDDEVEVTYTPIDSSSIVSMTLDDSGVKKTYLTYQSFSSEGLEATATRESGAIEVMLASELDIDYSAFDNTTTGEYTINVSYVENGYSFSASYNVEVIEEITGLCVGKETLNYKIGTSSTGADIGLDDLSVYSVDADGVANAALESGEYELKFFKGGDEISSLNNLGIGIYTIYAYRNVSIAGEYSTIQYECGAYVLCYVCDPITSVTLSSGTSAIYTQSASKSDLMSSTWAFDVVYESGIEGTFSGSDMVITNLVTTKMGDAKTATATYNERIKTSSVDVVISHDVAVTYSISGVSDDMYGTTEVYNFNDLKDTDVYNGAVLFDTFTSNNVAGTGTAGYTLEEMPEELEDLELSGRIQLSSSKGLYFSMILPGTVTIYGVDGTSNTDYVTMVLEGHNDTEAVAEVVGKASATINHSTTASRDEDKYVTFKCTAGDYYLHTADNSANILVIVIKYNAKTEATETKLEAAMAFSAYAEDLCLEGIDLSLPQQCCEIGIQTNETGKIKE